MKTALLVLSLIALAGCTAPNASTPSSAPAPVPIVQEPSAPTPGPAMSAASPSPSGATASMAWVPVQWGSPITYRVGWNTISNQYNHTALTSATNFQASGLSYSTAYYFAVQSLDANGRSSPWSQGLRYVTPKKTSPAAPKAPSTAQ